MKFITWLKITAILFLIVLGTIFFLQNTDHAPLQVPFGRAVHVRLIYVILASFIAGAVSMLLLLIKFKMILGKDEEKTEDLVEDE